MKAILLLCILLSGCAPQSYIQKPVTASVAPSITTIIESTGGPLAVEVDSGFVGWTPVRVTLPQAAGTITRTTTLKTVLIAGGREVAAAKVVSAGEAVPGKILLHAFNPFDAGTLVEER